MEIAAHGLKVMMLMMMCINSVNYLVGNVNLYFSHNENTIALTFSGVNP